MWHKKLVGVQWIMVNKRLPLFQTSNMLVVDSGIIKWTVREWLVYTCVIGQDANNHYKSITTQLTKC